MPELAGRAHQQHIVPVVRRALEEAGIGVQDLDAIAFTRGPGLLGSLLVGISFAKGLSIAANLPLIEVNHLTGHVLSHFIDTDKKPVSRRFLFFACLFPEDIRKFFKYMHHWSLRFWGKPLMTLWRSF